MRVIVIAGGFTKTKTWVFATCSLAGDFPNTLLFTHLGGSVSSLVGAVKVRSEAYAKHTEF